MQDKHSIEQPDYAPTILRQVMAQRGNHVIGGNREISMPRAAILQPPIGLADPALDLLANRALPAMPYK